MQRSSNHFKLVKCIACAEREREEKEKKLYYSSREAVPS